VVVYLGHHGDRCPTPREFRRNFTIVHTTGVHTVNVSFCGCSSTDSHACTQLLRSGLLPASVDMPRTAFSFDMLDEFHLLTLQAKTSAFDYYMATAHKTDNVGILNQKVRMSKTLLINV
jgi:hypothetical protein